MHILCDHGTFEQEMLPSLSEPIFSKVMQSANYK